MGAIASPTIAITTPQELIGDQCTDAAKCNPGIACSDRDFCEANYPDEARKIDRLDEELAMLVCPEGTGPCNEVGKCENGGGSSCQDHEEFADVCLFLPH